MNGMIVMKKSYKPGLPQYVIIRSYMLNLTGNMIPRVSKINISEEKRQDVF